MNSEEKVTKKITFSSGEYEEVQIAMEEEGERRLHDYIMNAVRTRGIKSNAERRRQANITYHYSELFSIYNKLRSGIDIENNIHRFIEGTGKICQELK